MEGLLLKSRAGADWTVALSVLVRLLTHFPGARNILTKLKNPTMERCHMLILSFLTFFPLVLLAACVNE